MTVDDILNKPSTEQPGKLFRKIWDDALLALEAKLTQGKETPAVLCDTADMRITLWCFGFEPRESTLPKARQEVHRALALQPNFPPAHTLHGVLDLADWQWRNADKHLQCAIELDPANAWAHHWYALFLAAMGRHEEAIQCSKRSVDMDKTPGLLVGHGSIYYFAQQFDKLADVMEQAIAETPENAPAYDWLGMAYVQLGRYDESIAVYRKAAELSDGLAEILAGLGHAYGVAGRRADAERILNYLEACAEHNYVPPVQIAFVAFGLGDADRGFTHLERAWREQSWELAFARAEPWLDHLHGDPRFQDLLARIGFPPKP